MAHSDCPCKRPNVFVISSSGAGLLAVLQSRCALIRDGREGPFLTRNRSIGGRVNSRGPALSDQAEERRCTERTRMARERNRPLQVPRITLTPPTKPTVPTIEALNAVLTPTANLAQKIVSMRASGTQLPGSSKARSSTL